MSLHIFDKMLARFTALAISILFFQVSGSQTNGSNVLSNLIINNSLGNQSQGNIIQKSLNQFVKNRMLPNNQQQAFNLQNSQILQSQGSQGPNLQSLNSQQFSNLQSVNTQPISSQSGTNQQPVRVQSMNIQQTQNLQPVNTLESLHSQTINSQLPLNLQNSRLSIQPFSNLQQSSINLQQTSLPNQNALQQNLYAQNPPQSNVLITSQFSDVSAPANGGQTVQSFQGTNALPSSTVTLTSPGSISVVGINNPGVESMPIYCLQNQQNAVSSIASNINDGAQISNAVPASLFYSTSQSNQPKEFTILAAPQQNQLIDCTQNSLLNAQNAIETPNQITILKSVQPESPEVFTVNQDYDSNRILPPAAIPMPMSPSFYPSILPTLGSVLASSLSNQASKSSNLNSLLPLIFNIIKERNSCGCNHHCGCSKNTNFAHQNTGDGWRNCLKQKVSGHRQEEISKYSNDYSKDFEEHGRYENRRNEKRYEEYNYVKPEGVEIHKEYEYSDEFYEDD